MISLSYSRASPWLTSRRSCSWTAIRDGVIEASINHEKGYPQLAFHQRISFCLDIHNMSVKVSTLCPQLPGGTDLESAEERREREQQDLEFAKEMAEDDDDGFP
uniref:26S proteasome non-ATPase regulatory subunit 3 C-terminal domain-containing protein n=1 Tax=Malurus cyaneus samueli TaxID=2593467 RepID=A0A8C5TPD7_9PASS